MGRFFWFLLILIVSVWIGLKISEDPGYFYIAYRQWSVEMPLWFAMLTFIFTVFLLYAILRFFDSIDFSIYRMKNWLRYRRKYKSYSKTNRGLIELIEGHWRAAEHYLLEGIEQSDAPLINYLAAAKAAQELKAYDRRDNYLRKAHQISPQAEIGIGITQAKLQFEQGQLEQSLATLGHLRNIAPKHGFVLKLLEKVYIRLADWGALLKLLPSLKKAKLINEEQYVIFEKNVYQELLHNAGQKHENLHNIQTIWQSIPKKIQKDPDLVYTYVKLLFPYSEMADQIEVLINKTLKKSWHKDLVKLYGLIQATHPKDQLVHAENWQKQYGNHAILFLTLGRICMRCQLWGKARHYFEDSLKLEMRPETFVEYGRLLEKIGETTAAVERYREGLLLAAAQFS